MMFYSSCRISAPDVLDLETLTEDGPKDVIVEQKGQDVVTIREVSI